MQTPELVIRDFRNFLFLVHQHLDLPDPTPVQFDLCLYLQQGPKRCMIQAFRGVGKSHITSAFVCWMLLRNPQLNILVVSASKDRADNFSAFTKRLIAEMPMLAHLKAGQGQRDSVMAFDVGPATIAQFPSVKSVGITGQITGSRADIIIADDIESLNNSLTQTMRDQLLERIKEFDAVLKPLDGSRIIYLGTPQTENSLYQELPNRGYHIAVWPARVPADPDRYKGNLAPFVYNLIERGQTPWTLVDPLRFSELDLTEREASYGRSGFMLQYMLDTSLSDVERYPLKLSDLMIHTLDPRLAPVQLAWASGPEQIINDLQPVGMAKDRYHRPMFISKDMAEYTGSVMAIDPSGRGADETAYAVVKILHGNLYVVAAGGFKDGYSEDTLKALSIIAATHKVNYIVVEANFGDGMFSQLLKTTMRPIYPCTVEEVRHSSQKERRICDVLEPVMNSHRLIVDRKVVEDDLKVTEPKKQLLYQLTRITRDKGSLKHDDKLDALSMAVQYWVESMGADQKAQAEAHRDEMLMQELVRFEDSVFTMGGPHKNTSKWVNI